MNPMVDIYLGLGGNITNELGDPKTHILRVCETLKQHSDFKNVKCSSLYVSKPFGVTDQPDFINAVLSAQTSLSALILLDLCQQLEQDAKRVRLRHWGERSLDVDILLYGDEVIRHDRLMVPHAGLFERNFVIVPLLELVPDLVIQGQALKALPANNWSGLAILDVDE